MKKVTFLFYCLVVSKIAFANIHGSDIQSFNPAADNGNFVTVQGTKILTEGTLNLGGFFDYAENTLPAALDATNSKYSATNKITSSDLHMALGLSNRWQVGLSLGSTLDTQVKPDSLRDYYKSKGLTDVRLNTKVNFYQSEQWGWAVHLLADLPQVENDYLYGKSSSPSYAAELLATVDFTDWSLAANVGYNFRQIGERITSSPYDPVGDAALGSVAGAYRFPQTKWTVVAEVYGTIVKEGTVNYSQNDLSALEGLVGAKYKMKPTLEWQAGLTGAFSKGVSSPDNRIYVGLNWLIEGLWAKNIEPAKPIVIEAPAPVVPAAPALDFPPMSNFIVSNMNFESGSSKVSDGYLKHLKEFVVFVNAKKSFKQVTIKGFTDNVGSEASNLKLSEDRANAVKKILIQNGLDKNKVIAQGLGEANPIASNHSKEGRYKNRRIEFIVEE